MGFLKSTAVTKRLELPVADGEVVQLNRVACLNTDTGKLEPESDSETLIPIGWFDRFPTNFPGTDTFTGDGTTKVEVELLEEIEMWGWDNDDAPNAVTEAELGQTVYMAGDNVISTDGTGRSSGGRAVEIDPEDGRVYTTFGLRAQGPTGGQGTATYEAMITQTKTIQLDLAAGLADIGTDAPLALFADGASSETPGLTFEGGKAFGIRWNNFTAHDPVVYAVPLPFDLDDAENVVVKVLAAKTGATLADATTFTIGAYFQTVGALYDADANAGGATGAMTGDATAKTVQEVSRTIAAADVPAAPGMLTLTIQPTDGTLQTDDVVLLGIRLEYTPKAA